MATVTGISLREQRPMEDSMPLTQLDPSKTALVLIDLQRGITSFPAEPHTTTEVIANATRLADAFRAVAAPVILVHVSTSLDGSDRLHLPVDEPQALRQLSADFAEIVAELGPHEGDIVVAKRQWGAFYGTDLDLQLRRRGITTVVLGGIATNYGVESTARDGYERGYQLLLVEDAMSARSAADHAFAFVRIFPRLGRVCQTADVIAALGAQSVRRDAQSE
jgi:nicotinamidase-related amidase